MHYTTLHRIVLGLADATLVQQLDLDNSKIDQVDSHGRTPLHWAARRADLNETESLLEWGASPNLADHEETTALHDAASDGTEECVVALLEAGADVNARSIYGSTALHHVFFQQKAQEGIINALIRCGADPNATNHSDSSPLFYAIPITRAGQLQNVQALHRYGAEIDIQKPNGDTLVFCAIRHNDTQMLQFLSANGARFDRTGPYKRNILHFAARKATIETMRILEKLQIKEIDAEAEDATGATPAEAFETQRPQLFSGERAPMGQERAAFDALVVSTKPTAASVPAETPIEALQDKVASLKLTAAPVLADTHMEIPQVKGTSLQSPNQIESLIETVPA